MPDRLDFSDAAALALWLRDLRVAYKDVAAVAEDMLRPRRKRDLGHLEHERLYRDANEKMTQLLAYAGMTGDAEQTEGGGR